MVLLLKAHDQAPPSDWVRRWVRNLPASARVLDLACGSGRHFRLMSGLGLQVTGVDRDAEALQPLHALGEVIEADLESGPWPLGERSFDAVVVTHYLWRPRMAQVLDCVAPGGLLIYETFERGHEALGRPQRPEFLLEPGELLRIAAPWQIVGYESGLLSEPARRVQRLCARRPAFEGDLDALPLN